MFKKIICILVSIAFICCATPVPLSSGVITPNNPVLPLGGRDDYKEIVTEYDYDDYGNVIQIRQLGDSSDDFDQRQINKDYAYLDTDENFLIRQVHEEKLDDIGGQKVAEQFFIYDDNTGWENQVLTLGELKKQISWLNTEANPDNWPTQNFTYDDYGNVISKTDANGNETQIEYDSENYYSIYPTKITNALLQETTQTFDLASGKVLTATDPNGVTVENVYDQFYRPEKIIGPYDSETYPGVTYEYDYDTQPIRVTKNQRIIPQQPDENNLLSSHTFYDGLGRVIQTQSPAENDNQVIVSNKTYNSKDSVIDQYIPYYDAKPESPAYLTAQDKPKQSFTYDVLSRPLVITNTDGTFRTFEYLDSLWETSALDEKSHKLETFRDAYGNTKQVNFYQGSAEPYTLYAACDYTYDALNNLTSILVNSDEATRLSFAYDSLSRKTSETDPDRGGWSFEYDKNGNLTSRTDALGQEICLTYDALNRPLTKAEAGRKVSAINTTYTYDGPTHTYSIGRLSTVENSAEKKDFNYDCLGRVTQKDYLIKSRRTGSYTVNWQYDLLSRITSVTYPDEEIVNYTYNPQGVESVGSYVTDVDYNAQNKITNLTYGNNTSTDYTYYDEATPTPSYRLKEIKVNDGALQDLSYTYDNVGNITSIRDEVRDETFGFQYDEFNRLTSADKNGAWLNWAYDNLGRITYASDIGNYLYGDSNHLHAYTEAGTNTASYDLNGNQIAQRDKVLSYDQENRLTQITDCLGKINIGLFSYGGDGQRVTKALHPFMYGDVDFSGSVTTVDALLVFRFALGIETSTSEQFVVGDVNLDNRITTSDALLVFQCALGMITLPQPVDIKVNAPVEFMEQMQKLNKEYSETNAFDKAKATAPETITTSYVDNLYEVEEGGAEGSISRKHIFLGANRICSITTNNELQTTNYFHTDHLGSTRLITDEEGVVQEDSSYKPFGDIDQQSGDVTAYKFTGKELDDPTGLYYYGARYYNPELGVFISADSLIPNPYDFQSLNRYAYCRNNPVVRIDPDGHKDKKSFKDQIHSLFNSATLGIGNQMDKSIEMSKLGREELSEKMKEDFPFLKGLRQIRCGWTSYKDNDGNFSVKREGLLINFDKAGLNVGTVIGYYKETSEIGKIAGFELGSSFSGIEVNFVGEWKVGLTENYSNYLKGDYSVNTGHRYVILPGSSLNFEAYQADSNSWTVKSFGIGDVSSAGMGTAFPQIATQGSYSEFYPLQYARDFIQGLGK